MEETTERSPIASNALERLSSTSFLTYDGAQAASTVQTFMNSISWEEA